MEIDRHYLTLRQLVAAIEHNIDRLEGGGFTLAELEHHLELTRTLYERTLVLQYKAFENQSSPTQQDPDSSPKEHASTDEHTHQNSSIVEFDFASNLDAVKNTDEYTTQIDEIEKENKLENVSMDVSRTLTHNLTEEAKEASHSRLHQRFFAILEEVSQQVGMHAYGSLHDSFGLNERLLFINELFGGSSDDFVRAIEFLDTIPIASSTVSFFEDLSKKYKWDIDSQSVEDFILKICRKYV